MLHKTRFFIVLFVGLFVYCPAQDWQWASQAGGSGVDHGQQIATAKDGSVYLTGTYTNTAVIGNDTFESNGKKDIFLSKLSSNGEFIWSLSFGSPKMDFCYDIETDLDGGLIITGSFRDSLEIENTVLRSPEDMNVFMMNFSGDGVLLWANQFGAEGYDGNYSMETDKKGNIYCLTTMDENSEDSTVTNKKTYNRIKVSKFSPSGKLLWEESTYGQGFIVGNAICLDNDNNLYLTGEYRGMVGYGVDTLVNEYGIFLIKLNDVGELIWHETLGSDHIRAFGADLVADSSGHLYLTGGFDGIGQFGPDIMSSLGNLDIFVAQFDASNGALIWLERAGGNAIDKGLGLCLADSGFYLTGYYESYAYFGYDTTLVANGGTDFFIAKYKNTGSLDWVDAPISKGLGYGKSIQGDGKGNFYCTGWFTGILNFPTDLLIGTTRPDVFIAKFRDDDD